MSSKNLRIYIRNFLSVNFRRYRNRVLRSCIICNSYSTIIFFISKVSICILCRITYCLYVWFFYTIIKRYFCFLFFWYFLFYSYFILWFLWFIFLNLFLIYWGIFFRIKINFWIICYILLFCSFILCHDFCLIRKVVCIYYARRAYWSYTEYQCHKPCIYSFSHSSSPF